MEQQNEDEAQDRFPGDLQGEEPRLRGGAGGEKRRVGCLVIFQRAPWLAPTLGVLAVVAWFGFLVRCGIEGDKHREAVAAEIQSRRDKQCERQLFIECLEKAATPKSTHYTDQEETVFACQHTAEDMCRRGSK